MARKKLTIDKYNYGSYVISNQQQGVQIPPPVDPGQSMISGAGTGASIGQSFGGPIGAGIGAVGGFLVGGISSNIKNKKLENKRVKNRTNMLAEYDNIYNANLDTVNETPFGTYQSGGDITSTQINIEKGELQVDPETGKVLREFTGINPETGGLYKPHAPGNKKDSKNNIVTAEEGTFVITKAKAKDYKDALENNDKLAQNSIMHNIRNKKRQSMKFATGGLIEPITKFAGVNPNTNLTTSTRNLIAPVTVGGATVSKPSTGPVKLGGLNLSVDKSANLGTVNKTQGFDWQNTLNYLPGVINMLQGLGSPNTMPYANTPTDPYRNQVLANMPKDINYTPLFNRIYNDRNTAYNLIDETTNSSAVARANKLNVMANTQRGIQDTFFQGEDYNNRVRSQRAGIYGQLGQQDIRNQMMTRDYNYGVGTLNRQMQEGRRQQFNYGLSQLGEMYNNIRTNTQLQERDRMLMNMLPDIYAGAAPYFENWFSQRGGNNGRR